MSATPGTIVLIHGLWITPRSREKWAERYESRGNKVLAPGSLVTQCDGRL
jgi:hypothetical protein